MSIDNIFDFIAIQFLIEARDLKDLFIEIQLLRLRQKKRRDGSSQSESKNLENITEIKDITKKV